MKIVIKIGTSTLISKNGRINGKYVSELANNISALQNDGHEIIIVSSGAIGAAAGYLKLKSRPKTLREKQALAAVGQPIIMNAYSREFKKHKKTVAQVLLTRDDFDNRTKYINARNTLSRLLEQNIIPVINENDTVAFEEINFGDNDTLAALVAAAVDADKLFLFTDVDGLYEGHPSRGLLIRTVENINEEIESFADGKSSSGKGTGGMKTKIVAAKIATLAGVDTVIANGGRLGILKEIIANEKEYAVCAENVISSLNENEMRQALKKLALYLGQKEQKNKTRPGGSLSELAGVLRREKNLGAQTLKSFMWHLREDEIDLILRTGGNEKEVERFKKVIAGSARLPFTAFIAKVARLEAKKSWIAFSKKSKGNVYADKKAVEALKEKGKSLLAAGITAVSGNFKRGDTVTVTDAETKKDFAKGLINFDSGIMRAIKGMKSSEIKKMLDSPEQEVIHRDNLVIL